MQFIHQSFEARDRLNRAGGDLRHYAVDGGHEAVVRVLPDGIDLALAPLENRRDAVRSRLSLSHAP
jgi:hypothetical protein